jgi:hypothetical protein
LVGIPEGLNLLELSGLVQACIGIALPLPLTVVVAIYQNPIGVIKSVISRLFDLLVVGKTIIYLGRNLCGLKDNLSYLTSLSSGL